MTCCKCQRPIPVERIDAFAEMGRLVSTCVDCSDEEPVATFMVFGHKTGGSVVVIPNRPDGTRDPEAVRQAQRANRRAR